MVKKKTVKNEDMLVMLGQLRPLLTRKDIFGYAAARNTRILTNCLTEYSKVRDELIERFGTEEKNQETGFRQTVIKVGTPAFESFCEAIAPFSAIEHEVEIMTMKYEDTLGCLTGEEILSLDWMLEE